MENKDVIAVNSVGDTENQCVTGGDINARLTDLFRNYYYNCMH